jgi:hypothetical protein
MSRVPTGNRVSNFKYHQWYFFFIWYSYLSANGFHAFFGTPRSFDYKKRKLKHTFIKSFSAFFVLDNLRFFIALKAISKKFTNSHVQLVQLNNSIEELTVAAPNNAMKFSSVFCEHLLKQTSEHTATTFSANLCIS